MKKQFTIITLSFYGNNEFYTTVIDLMPDEEDDEKYPDILDYEKAYRDWEKGIKLPFAKKQFNLLGLDENRRE